jgi:hypothetical protein
MEEIKDRKAFNFYRSYWEVAQMLNNKNRLAFLDALLSRQFTGEEPTFKGTEQAKFAWVSQKHSIDSQIDGFINKKIAISKQGITPSIPPTEPTTEPPLIPPAIPPSVQEKEKEKGKVKEEVIDTLLFSDNEANEANALNENSNTVSTVVSVTETPQSTVVTGAEMPQSKVDKNILDKTKEKTTCLSFEEFWDLYDKKVELKKCKSKYEKVSEKDRKKIKETLPLYLKTITDKQYQKNPSTYLNNQCWNDEIIEKPSAYKKKEEQEKPSVAPAEDYHRFIDLIRSNPILNESRNMLLEFEYNNLKMSFDEIVSLLPKIASMERRRGLYLELIDERDRIAYYKNKLNK